MTKYKEETDEVVCGSPSPHIPTLGLHIAVNPIDNCADNSFHYLLASA